MNINYKITSLLVFVLCFISACSSSSTTSEPQNAGTNLPGLVDGVQRISSLSEAIGSFEGVGRIGWFEIDESDQIPHVSSTAVFFEIDSANPQSNRATIFLDTLGDTCAVEYQNSRLETLFNDMRANGRTVCVGAVITMFEVDAPYKYSELAHVGLATEGAYISYLDLPYPSPALLNISAEGEVFSAFSLTVEKPSALSGLSVANGNSIDFGASITWSPSEDADTMLHLRMEQATNISSSFHVDCMLIDDGEFTLPTSLSLGIDSASKLRLQVANRNRVGSVRVGTDKVVMVRSASRYRSY